MKYAIVALLAEIVILWVICMQTRTPGEIEAHPDMMRKRDELRATQYRIARMK